MCVEDNQYDRSAPRFGCRHKIATYQMRPYLSFLRESTRLFRVPSFTVLRLSS
jgi:hypothetical protein